MPEDQVPVAETLAVTDSPREADFEKFAARSAPKADPVETPETKPEQHAESGAADTSEKTKPEEKSETAAEPGAAKQQEPKKGKDKLSADERIAQLTAEIKKLSDAQAKAAKPEAVPEAKVEPPKRPNPFKWEGTPEEFEQAMDKWELHQKSEAVAEFQQGQQRNTAVQQFVAKIEETRKRYPEFDTVADQTAAALLEAPAEVRNWFQKSPYWGDLVYVLGSEPEALADFMQTAKTDVHAAMRKLAFLEIEVGNELAKAAKPVAEKTPATPGPRAPKPPSEVGGRGTPPADDLEDAVRNGDYRRAKQAMNREHFVS